MAESITGAGDFGITLISNGNPLVSNISFNASVSLNGYTIQCLQVGGPNRTCDIIIAGNFSVFNIIIGNGYFRSSISYQ